jgi:DNA segregation ATPase FtsK/SpoIIIE-like protein
MAVRTCPGTDAGDILPAEFLRAWLISEIDQRLYDIEVIAQACGYTFMEGEDEQASLVMHINRCSSADVYRSTLILMMQVDRPLPNHSVPTMLNVMVTKLNLDTKALTKAATVEAKAVYADMIKAAQAQLAEMKSGEPVAPKAQSDIQLSPRVIKAVKPRASKVRLSADEALSSIAAAMQVQEEAAGDNNAAAVSEQREDAMYQEAVGLVRKEGKPSISLVQRHLKVGYNQAARLLDQMEAEGLITAMGSDGSRSIVEQAAAVEGQQDEQPEPVSTKIAAVTAKYRGMNGETWSGRGLKPKWVTAYIDQGGALENLLVPQEPLSTDPIYAQALALITVEQKASKRLFKEHLKIGQTKALQLLDELEQHGKVSAIDETGNRKVLVAA